MNNTEMCKTVFQVFNRDVERYVGVLDNTEDDDIRHIVEYARRLWKVYFPNGNTGENYAPYHSENMTFKEDLEVTRNTLYSMLLGYIPNVILCDRLDTPVEDFWKFETPINYYQIIAK